MSNNFKIGDRVRFISNESKLPWRIIGDKLEYWGDFYGIVRDDNGDDCYYLKVDIFDRKTDQQVTCRNGVCSWWLDKVDIELEHHNQQERCIRT